MRIQVTSQPFSPDEELTRFAQDRASDAGALASFVGYCRGSSPEGAVARIELDHYPGFTEAEVSRLAGETAARHSLLDFLVIHRVGAIEAGEPIVLVAALSAHRAAALAAVGEMMDYLKTDAPFWKREVGPRGARWIDPTADDYARRKGHRS